ncbi:MAG: glycosyltransferase [Kiritimatiellae bacterium]|nr:glycosyltransferase [Kiritimatiellia bacterium]
MAKKVLFWGRFDPGYSRNRVYAALFRELGWEVDFFFVKVSPKFGDVEAFLRGLWRRPKPDLVWVPVCRQRDILAACRWAHRRGVKVLFDPMISAWDKKVLEQRKWKAEEPRARRLHARETRMMNAPDMVTWDTSCHLDFCAEQFGVPREKMRVLFTGTDETVFAPQPPPPPDPEGKFRVLYHGAYLPLHGTEVIVEAARRTQGLPIRWDFLGWGAYKASTEAKAAGLSNVRFLDKVPYTEVPKVIGAHDVVLGVFGTTAKAARVIGNKVYECMACRRPTINEFCTGYPPEAKDCPAIKFIPAGDPDALVRAVEEYRSDWSRRDEYFDAARGFFDKHLSMKVIKRQLAGVLAGLGL